MTNPAALSGSAMVFVINEKETMLISRPAIFNVHLYALLFEKTNFRNTIKINKIIDKKQENMKIKNIPNKVPTNIPRFSLSDFENVCETFISILI